MRKIAALVTLTSLFFVSGINCIPNIGLTSLTDTIRGIFGLQ